MKFKLITQKTLTRRERFKILGKWISYILLILLFYGISLNGILDFRPLLIIPLTTAVAMFEEEFPAAVFGMFGGFFVDMATRTLLGFTSVLLLICCMFASLLIMFLIRRNWVNHLLITALTCVIIGFMYYVFNIWLWEKTSPHIIVTSYLLPSLISSVVAAPVIYFIVLFINNSFSLKEERTPHDSAVDTEYLKKSERT